MVLLQARQMEQRAGLQKTGLVKSRSDMWMLGVSLQGPEINDTTHFTPFFLVYGRDPILPLDTLLRPKFKYIGGQYTHHATDTPHCLYTCERKHVRGQGTEQGIYCQKRCISRITSPVNVIIKNQLTGTTKLLNVADVNLAHPEVNWDSNQPDLHFICSKGSMA